MARYTPEHKEATRRRMIETAGRRFKADGFDGAGIATLVADAGLTNGAFYGHFASKDDLIASVVTQQLADQVAVVDALPDLEAVVDYLREYLSPAHRDDRAGGCPSAALLDEVGRCDIPVREAYTAGSLAMIQAITRHLDAGEPERSTEQAIGLFSLLVGSVQLARAVTDPDLSDAILAAAYTNAMTLVGASEHAAPSNNQEQE